MFESGLEYACMDFHMHTVNDKEFKYSGNPNEFSKAYVQALKLAGIDIAVITNHNKFVLEEYKSIRKNAKKNDIYVLPGVELTIKEGANGIHTLIVFNPDEWISDDNNHIQTFLTQAFATITNPENKNKKSIFDLKSTLETLETYNRDYFVIFAHVDQNSGLFQECKGGLIETFSLIAPFKRRVLGLQKSRTNKNQEQFKEKFGYLPALVEGSDPKTLEEIGKNELKTYLKIGEYSFDTIKFALQDYKNRVCNSIPENKHGYIESIKFEGGKFDGQTITFSKKLNTLIGIRGSGKSSILESIRYIFEQDPKSDEKYKESLVKSVFGSGGKATIKLWDKYGKNYSISRILGESSSVLDNNDEDLPLSPISIIDGFQYFGQKDLSNSTEREKDLIEQLVGGKIRVSTDIKQYVDILSQSVQELLDVNKVPEEIAELLTRKEELKYKMDIFQEKGVADKLKKQTSYGRDESKLHNISEDLKKATEGFKKAYNEHFQIATMLDGYQSEYNVEKLDNAKVILDEYKGKISQMDGLIKEFENESEKIDEIISVLSTEIKDLSDEFASIKREIKDDELDVDSYVTMQTEFDKLKNTLKKLKTKGDSKINIETEFKKAVRNRNDALKTIFDAYSSEIDNINGSQKEIKIEISFKSDKEGFKSSLLKEFRGTGISETKYNTLVENFADYVALIDDWIINKGKKIQQILTVSEYGKLEEKLKSNYSLLLSEQVQNGVEIFYHGKSLHKHSIGQRASALVLFVLMQKENDIILIDQPEDDLDNKVIYEEVIRAISDSKPNMQFIFATHNANIPVLGDAERILTFEYQDSRIEVLQGNIDCKSSHKQIVDIMEGGKEAFEKRQLVYTSWK